MKADHFRFTTEAVDLDENGNVVRAIDQSPHKFDFEAVGTGTGELHGGIAELKRAQSFAFATRRNRTTGVFEMRPLDDTFDLAAWLRGE